MSNEYAIRNLAENLESYRNSHPSDRPGDAFERAKLEYASVLRRHLSLVECMTHEQFIRAMRKNPRTYGDSGPASAPTGGDDPTRT